MGNLLEQGAQWLEDQRHQHLTTSVVYARAITSVTVSATIGRTEFETVDESGLLQKFESRDFLIKTTDLVLNFVQTFPKAGDKIKESDGSTTYLYEVMAPAGEPVFRYSDQYRKTLRIHTKFIGTE